MLKKHIGILLAVGVFAIWQFFSYINTAQRDDKGNVIDSGQVNAFEIQLGDCLIRLQVEAGGTTEFDEVTAVPCTEPHEREVYAETKSKLLAFDEAKIIEEADAFCRSKFESFIGIPYDDSGYFFDMYYPLEDSWNEADDRIIQCTVGEENYDLVSGSLEGSMQ